MGAASIDAMTYVPDATVVDQLNRRLSELGTARAGSGATVAIDGLGEIQVPEAVAEVLLQVLQAVAAGEGISVVPRDTLLTTQAAADMLGVSRPTLVRLLEAGEIRFAKHGRHRRVQLTDLLDYQQRSLKDRRESLDQMAAIGDEADLYERTVGPPPRTR